MEVIVTGERDERFVEFCKSFGCILDEPQVVLLLLNYRSTVGCASFKIFDKACRNGYNEGYKEYKAKVIK